MRIVHPPIIAPILAGMGQHRFSRGGNAKHLEPALPLSKVDGPDAPTELGRAGIMQAGEIHLQQLC